MSCPFIVHWAMEWMEVYFVQWTNSFFFKIIYGISKNRLNKGQRIFIFWLWPLYLSLTPYEQRIMYEKDFIDCKQHMTMQYYRPCMVDSFEEIPLLNNPQRQGKSVIRYSLHRLVRVMSLHSYQCKYTPFYNETRWLTSQMCDARQMTWGNLCIPNPSRW